MRSTVHDTTRPPMSGVLVAGVTALVSGVSVFVNAYGLRAVSSPAVYTTAKNLVATVALSLLAVACWRGLLGSGAASRFATPVGNDRPSLRVRWRGERPWARWVGLAYVGVIGGGLAFVLFFDGLAQSEPAAAAFWRDTLVIWVAIFALGTLRERIRWWNVAAIALLIAGEITVTGGVGQLAANHGELLVLSSSVLWAIEVIVAKALLRDVAPAAISVVRMGVGAVTLLGYLAATGNVSALVALSASQWRWALWCGLLLAAYVATWMTALSRARALDVTSVLVASAPITWLLQVAAGTSTPAASSLGLVLIGAGGCLVAVAAHRRASVA